MAGKNTTISSVQPMAGNLRIQTAVYGSVIPLVYGRTRISGNLVWYGGFTSIPHTTTTRSGGKGGGGVTQSDTSYTYTAALVMSLGEGVMNGVISAWKGKARYSGTPASNALATVLNEPHTVPAGRVVPVSVAGFVNNAGVLLLDINGDYMTATQGTDYTIDALGNYTFAAGYIGAVVYISYQYSAPAVSALSQLGLGFVPGYLGQPAWGYLASNYPAQALGYSGLAYLYAPSYDLGGTAEVPNHSFEVSTPWEQSYTVDADPGAIINDVLTNDRYGANWPAARLGSVAAVTNYARAQGLQISPALTVQKPAADWLRYLLDMCNCDCTWSQGKLKFVALGDAAVTANGVTYTPNLTPLYDLTEDHFIVTSPDEDAVKVQRKSSEDAYNHVRVEYTNRYNQYNTEIVEAKDSADISVRGVRTMPTFEAHAINEPNAANALCALILGRQMAVRNTYKFTLPWVFGLADPLDLLTLTTAAKGLNRTPVRVNKINELENNNFEFECEDCPVGMATAPAYGVQAGLGFAHDYSAAPGSISAPFFFEPPVQLTTTGLEVWVAVGGSSTMWGGCRVWASNDGFNYKQMARIAGGARYGALSANLGTTSGDTLGVLLAGQGGQLLSGSATDAARNQTLVFVGDAIGGEYLNYVTATLTGVKAYNLTTLNRGAYYSAAKARTANTATVVRIDEAIAKSDPLLPAQVGQNLYFKFTSFNVYGGGEESLANVQAYVYTPTGYMLKIKPPPMQNLVFDGVSKFTWDASVDPRDLLAGYRGRFQYGVNQSWEDAVPMNSDVITDSPYIASVLPQGSVTFMFRPVDIFGNESATSALVVTQLGDPLTANVIQSQDYKALGWPGVITGSASITGGNIVATNSAAAFGAAGNAAFSAISSDPAFPGQYAGISYTSPAFSPAAAGRMTLLYTAAASQYQINYRPVNAAPAFAGRGTQAAFPQGASAAAFAAPGAWSVWPGEIQASVQPYQFQVVFGVGTTQQQLQRLTAQVDVPDVRLKLSNVAISATGTRLSAAVGKFSAITSINLTLQAGGTTVDAQYTDHSATLGPNIICINNAGTQVAGTIDATLEGY